MDYKRAILEALKEEKKDLCIELSLESIEKNIYTIPELYENVLKTGLYSIDYCSGDDCIWKEHIKTSIVRSVIECLYPYIIKLKKSAKPVNKKVVLACPEKEYHEIGLRMVDDFFSILGYQSIFIGANTPKIQVLNAVTRTKADYLDVSVTDYYLLFEAQKMIQLVRDVDKDIKVIVGGNAFKENMDSLKSIGGDTYIETFEDLIRLRDGEQDEISI